MLLVTSDAMRMGEEGTKGLFVFRHRRFFCAQKFGERERLIPLQSLSAFPLLQKGRGEE